LKRNLTIVKRWLNDCFTIVTRFLKDCW